MKPFILIVAFICCCLSVFSQNNFDIAGIWKGESICQIKPSACNDEIVVYHITKGEKPNTYAIVMNKIVKGVEENMAVVDAIYSPAAKQLEGYDTKWHTHWIFNVNGTEMKGVLADKDGKTIFRKIRVERIKA